MIGVVVSRADSASERIGEHLLALADWDERTDPDRADGAGGGTYYRREGFALRAFADLHLRIEDAAAAFDAPDLVVFVSRHAGETGPLLTAHFTGNFGPAEYGGATGEFARACPAAQSAVVEALDAHAPAGYDVGVECTHHGPTAVGAPSMFVELGSGEDQWADPAGARAVARAVLDLGGVPADRVDPTRDGVDRDDGETTARSRHVVGFGGGHYAPRFERIARETGWAVGHVAADWALDAMGPPAENRAVIERAFAASGADLAVVDGDREALIDVVESVGHRVVSETWLRTTDGVALEAVRAVEDELRPVDEGLRFGAAAPAPGDHDAGASAAFTMVDLPDELVAAALGVDAADARAAVADHVVAYETTEGGTRPAGRAAVAARADRETLVDALAAVLAREYETVEQTGGAVIARTTGFDPAAARERGVPEGPAFGRLASGETVEIDGERVDPESVRGEQVDRFPV